MEETIIIPSPNWFHVSIMGASQDGWLVYGGPSRSLCFLEPLSADSTGAIDRKQRFKAHVFPRAHKEKVVCVDISPEWPEKRNVLTGGSDGVIKEWNIEFKDKSWIVNYLHCQEEHNVQKEECAGVCYGTPTISVSVGNLGNICKWDLNTNVVKRYFTHLKNFKPTCISCSPHKPLHVAVGTRQGVIFLIDITGASGKIIYKIRGQDDEINRVTWCPQFTVTVNKTPSKEKHQKEHFSASSRKERIRKDQAPSDALETALTERSQAAEDANKTQDEDEVIIPEDDMFDVYKDHETSEFGHKKYEPEEIYVKAKEETKDDFLVECEKLKAEILKNKNEPEPSIQSLVDALDNTHVKENIDKGESEHISTQELHVPIQNTQESNDEPKEDNEYKHLLASIGKYGGIKIWTQTGKMLASSTVLFHVRKDYKDFKSKGPNWPTLHWHTPDCLLITDGKNQLLKSNPLNIDGKNRLGWEVVHSLHRRGLYFVISDAPRVQTPKVLSNPASENWVVWTVGQDRNIISYNMKENKKIEVYASCGAFIYDIKPCAYDAGKIAMTAGDGSIRVWETHTTTELEDQLASGVITSYWQNVQGKILTLAWHPTKENLLAFATAESRVGLLDASGACEKPAKNFPSIFSQGVYSLSWGEGMNLYACGNVLAVFQANKVDEHAKEITVEIEGQVWDISAVVWTPKGLIVGSCNGGVALLDLLDNRVITATFLFSKMIYTIAWHPQQTTSSEEVSKYQNYVAVCSVDKINTIAIVEYEDKGDGAKQFRKIEPLSGHEAAVLHVAWNPHRDAQLLSTSQDCTVRIWNVLEGECIAIYGGHQSIALSAMWGTIPQLADCVLSSGGDCCLRLWDFKEYPVCSFAGVKRDAPKKKKQNKAREYRNKEKRDAIDAKNNEHLNESLEITGEKDKITEAENSENVATIEEFKLRPTKYYLLPVTARQMTKKSMTSVRTILRKYINGNKINTINISDVIKLTVSDKSLSFMKMFGTINELNELLDVEAQHHIETENLEAYLMLHFYRGNVDKMIQFASEHDLLDSYLLSLSPSVSFKCWKDTAQLYITQLDRMRAKNNDEKSVHRLYGGLIYKKATFLLGVHNLRGCIDVLMENLMFKEAYILCRVRHMDSIADEVLHKWAINQANSGALMMSSILHLVHGDVSEASIILGRSNNANYLKLAAELAKIAGHNSFATHIEAKVKTKESRIDTNTEQLKDLPSRIQTVLNEYESDSEQEDVDEDIIHALSEIVVDANDKGDSCVMNGNLPAAVNEKVYVDDDSTKVELDA